MEEKYCDRKVGLKRGWTSEEKKDLSKFVPSTDRDKANTSVSQRIKFWKLYNARAGKRSKFWICANIFSLIHSDDEKWIHWKFYMHYIISLSNMQRVSCWPTAKGWDRLPLSLTQTIMIDLVSTGSPSTSTNAVQEFISIATTCRPWT